LQLINHKTSVFSPIKKQLIDINNFAALNKDVNLKHFLHLKALTGDQSDNIDGLPKVGPKKGIKLAIEIVDNNNINCLNDEQKIIYERNMKLMDLKRGYIEEEGEKDYYDQQLSTLESNKNYNNFCEICRELQLLKILENKHRWYEKFFQKNRLNMLVEQLGLY
jgi:5'-3' exonuclease